MDVPAELDRFQLQNHMSTAAPRRPGIRLSAGAASTEADASTVCSTVASC